MCLKYKKKCFLIGISRLIPLRVCFGTVYMFVWCCVGLGLCCCCCGYHLNGWDNDKKIPLKPRGRCICMSKLCELHAYLRMFSTPPTRFVLDSFRIKKCVEVSSRGATSYYHFVTENTALSWSGFGGSQHNSLSAIPTLCFVLCGVKPASRKSMAMRNTCQEFWFAERTKWSKWKWNDCVEKESFLGGATGDWESGRVFTSFWGTRSGAAAVADSHTHNIKRRRPGKSHREILI